MSPISGKTDPMGDVYVLNRYVKGRPFKRTPGTNAERPDTDFFYDEGVYDAYPDRKLHYEERRDKERRDSANLSAWATRALAALDAGRAAPTRTRRPVLPEVLTALYKAGPAGFTRPELCRRLGRDGGKVSACMTDLHAAGIIYPLEGVRR